MPFLPDATLKSRLASACSFPSSTKGLNPEEYTIADHFKSMGYATACYGKWHLGHLQKLSRQNGFDHYFGIPYSNDMNHPDNKETKGWSRRYGYSME